MPRAFLIALTLLLSAAAAAEERFDIVLQGGRVVDPETNLDAVRNVGIRGDRIVQVTTAPLAGARIIDARGLVVAPGFIDLHQHQQEDETYRLKALDGVTTALEMETGVPDIARFIEVRRGKTLINYGATASHEAARIAAWDKPFPPSTFGPEAAVADPAEGPATGAEASPERLGRILEMLQAQLRAGALGIGVGLQYTPGATYKEVLAIFRLAAEFKRPIYVHIRHSGRLEPTTGVDSVGEVIGAAAITGAPLHIVHINSMCAADAPQCIDMIAGAGASGTAWTMATWSCRKRANA